jgi:hypothetical protein
VGNYLVTSKIEKAKLPGGPDIDMLGSGQSLALAMLLTTSRRGERERVRRYRLSGIFTDICRSYVVIYQQPSS